MYGDRIPLHVNICNSVVSSRLMVSPYVVDQPDRLKPDSTNQLLRLLREILFLQ